MSTRHRWPVSMQSLSLLTSPLNHLCNVVWVAEHTVPCSFWKFAVDEWRWWICLMDRIPECAQRTGGEEADQGLWSPRSRWQLPSPGRLLALHGSCAVHLAPETTVMSSRTSGLNKVISVQHVSKRDEKIRYEQMDGFSPSISLWWILQALLPMVCLFSILEHFSPRYKIQYLKVGSGKVDQIILRSVPQMCLFIHVWNAFFPQITGHVKS